MFWPMCMGFQQRQGDNSRRKVCKQLCKSLLERKQGNSKSFCWGSSQHFNNGNSAWSLKKPKPKWRLLQENFSGIIWCPHLFKWIVSCPTVSLSSSHVTETRLWKKSKLNFGEKQQIFRCTISSKVKKKSDFLKMAPTHCTVIRLIEWFLFVFAQQRQNAFGRFVREK